MNRRRKPLKGHIPSEKVTGTARKKQNKRILKRNIWLRRIIWGSIGLLLTAIVVATIVFRLRDQTATTGPIQGVKTYQGLSQDHKEGTLTYPQNPPVGGPHNATWQNCGIYDQAIRNENAIHSLEHGAVWITYRPDLSAQGIDQLKRLAQGRAYVLLSPFPNLPTPVVLNAWSTQLQLTKADDPRAAKFLSTYEQGPQTPEQGATCSGGTGTPTA